MKIQYPGVAESISSDLKLVKLLLLKCLISKEKILTNTFKRLNKLIEETNYNLEIEQSKAIAEACKHLPHISSPIIMKIGLVIELLQWTT